MALGANIKALARLSLFAGFEPEALRLIAFAAQPLQFGAGDVVFRRDELSDGGYLVVSGSVRVDAGHDETEGDERIIGPGALLGERALLTATTNAVSAIARENTATLKISRDLLRRVLEEFPASAASMQRALAKELQRLGGDIEKSRQAISK